MIRIHRWAAVAVFLAAGVAEAQAPQGDITLLAGGTGAQGHAAADADPSGAIYVAWHEAPSTLKLTRLANGKAAGWAAPVVVSTSTPWRYSAFNHTVVARAGGVHVLWSEVPATGGPGSAFVRRYDGAGAPQGAAPHRVDGVFASGQNFRGGFAAGDGKGGLWFVAGRSGTCEVRHLGPDGAELASVTLPGNGQCALDADGASGAVVAWTVARSATANDVMVQRFTSAGQPAWAALRLTRPEADSEGVKQVLGVTLSGSGALVQWTLSGGSTIRPYRTMIVGVDGQVVAGAPSGGAVRSSRAGRVVADGAGGWLAVTENEWGRSLVRVSSTGAQVWEAIRPPAHLFDVPLAGPTVWRISARGASCFAGAFFDLASGTPQSNAETQLGSGCGAYVNVERVLRVTPPLAKPRVVVLFTTAADEPSADLKIWTERTEQVIAPVGLPTIKPTLKLPTGTTAPTATTASWFCGVESPVNGDGSSLFQLGRVIPVKFKLSCNGSPSPADAQARLFTAKISDGMAGTQMQATTNAQPDAGNLFRYDAAAGHYIYNLSTTGMTPGTWQLKIVFADGSERTANISLIDR